MTRLAESYIANERAYLSGIVEILRVGLDAHPLIDPACMRAAAHEQILRAVLELHEVGEAVNELAIITRLRGSGQHVDDETVFACCNAGDDSASLAKRAEWIRNDHELRGIADKARLIGEAVKKGDARLARELAAGVATEAGKDRPYVIKSAHESAWSAMQMAVDSLDAEKSRIRFEDEELSQGLGRLGPGTLTVIGAATGVGKSTLALYFAKTSRAPVGIVSLEDPPEVYGARILSPYAGVSSSVIFTGDVGDFQTMEALGNGLQRVGRVPSIAYAIGAALPDVISAIRALVQQHGCKLVVVDYVQAIRLNPKLDRRIAIADAVAQVKAAAAKCGAALVCCSQLSRPPSEAKFREPMTHHLKETGDLENMAEAVVLLWQTTDKPGADVFGKVAKLKWGFAGHRFRFERDGIGNLVRCVPWSGDDMNDAPSTSGTGLTKWTKTRHA